MRQFFVLLALVAMAAFLTTSCSDTDDLSLDAKASTTKSANAYLDSTVTDYPMAIDDYVIANYPEDAIDEVELDSLGNFEVELTSGIELLFDASGNFIEVLPDDMENDDMDSEEDEGEEDDDSEMDHEDEDECDDDEEEGDEDEMDEDEMVTDYPASIDDYIAANHPGAMIVEIELEDDGTYEVELDDDTEIIFDSEGNFVEYDD